MAGNKEGAAKARATILAQDPDFYAKIGAKSWDNPDRSRETGFALLPEDKRKELGAKGGRKTKKEYKKYQPTEEEQKRIDFHQEVTVASQAYKDGTGVSE